MEKQLLNSFFIRFNNFVNNKVYDGFLSPSNGLKIKQVAKNVFTIENINVWFNVHTLKIYSIVKDAVFA